jgi:hypothetical protein
MPHYVCGVYRIYHRGIFSLLLVLTMLIFASNSSHAQVSFDENGLLKDTCIDRCYQGVPTVHIVKDAALSTKSAKQLKKWLLERVNATIYYLSDAGNSLQYDLIWGQTERTQIQNELNHLQDYLTGKAAANNSNRILPTSSEIENLTQKIETYALADTTIQYDPNAFMARLLRYDPLKRYLFNRYTTDLTADDPALNLTINYDYVSQWRKLENHYDSILVWQREIKWMDSTLMYDERRIDAIIDAALKIDLSKLNVVTAINSSAFMKRWTWLNDGVIAINPLNASDAADRFPADEPNRFQTPQMAKELDSVHNSKRLKEFSTYTKLYNKALFPRDPRTEKKKGRNQSTAYLQAYDANNGYRKLTCPLNFIGENDYLRVAVHNIAADKVLTPKFSNQKINEENSFTAGLNEAASSIGTLMGVIQPKTAAFSLLAGMINSQHFDSPTGTILTALADVNKIRQAGQKYSDTLEAIMKAQMKDSLFAPEDTNESWSLFESKPRAVIINGILVPMNQKKQTEDKRNILWVSDRQTNYSFGNPNPAFARSIEVFLEFDRYIFMDYSDTSTLAQSAKSLLERFNKFKTKLNDYNTCAQKASNIVREKGHQIESYLRITNRSLPTKELKSITDTTSPAYRTAIYKPENNDAFNKLTLIVEETIEGKKETANTVIDQSVKITKYRKFDVSIGLAFTTGSYEVISQKGTTPPTTETANRLQFMAGGHWYFAGRMNKLDGHFVGCPRERLSLFAGLGINYPLENYYLALSYDLVPGFKAMAGGHFYKDQRFKVRNDVVVDKASAPAFAGLFFSLNLEPVTLVKLVGLIK